MNHFSWSEKFFDDHIDEAWKRFQANLSEDFSEGLDELHDIDFDDYEEMNCINDLSITLPDGRKLSSSVCKPEDDVYLVWVLESRPGQAPGSEDETPVVNITFSHQDEAAGFITNLLRNDWGVIHPSFLELSRNPEISSSESIPDNPGIGEPTEGFADSEEVLRHWVTAALIDWDPSVLKATKSGNFRIDLEDGTSVGIMVRSPEIIEICAKVADDLEPGIAKEALLEILSVQSPFKYFLADDGIIMASYVNCVPFNKKVFLKMLGYHIQCIEKLSGSILQAIIKATKTASRIADEAEATSSNLKSLMERAGTLKNELAEARNRIDVLTHQRNWAKENLDKQNAETAEWKAKATGATDKSLELARQVRKQAELIENLRDRVDAQKLEHEEDLRNAYAQKQQERADLIAQNEKYAGIIRELQINLQALEIELAETRNQGLDFEFTPEEIIHMSARRRAQGPLGPLGLEDDDVA